VPEGPSAIPAGSNRRGETCCLGAFPPQRHAAALKTKPEPSASNASPRLAERAHAALPAPMSGGEQQMLALARGPDAGRRAILLIDEALRRARAGPGQSHRSTKIMELKQQFGPSRLLMAEQNFPQALAESPDPRLCDRARPDRLRGKSASARRASTIMS